MKRATAILGIATCMLVFTLAACKTTNRMDKGQRKELLKIKNLDRLFETIDSCF